MRASLSWLSRLFSGAPRRSRLGYAVIITSFLSACASPLPSTVSVPVAVGCLPPDVPELPSVSTNDALVALSDYELVLRIASERLDLIAYSRAASVIIEACR